MRREAGFTMIEVLIAMTLTALAIMGIIALFITETKASGFSRHTTEAAVLVQDKIERLRTQPSAAIAATVEANINERGMAGGIYTRTYSEVPAAEYADIFVQVDWNDDGVAHTVSMQARRNP